MAANHHFSLHRRQFILGPVAQQINPHWRADRLEPGLWLSYCSDLRVTIVKDAEGYCWHLLGIAISTLKEQACLESQIAQSATAAVPKLSYSWAGRWLLIGQGQVYLDASGLLGCFYGAVEGQTWASSSAVLLASLLPATQIDPRPLYYEIGVSWYTPPRSRFNPIHRLLPSQVLHVQSGRVLPRSLMPAIQPESDYSSLLSQIQTCLVTTLQHLPGLGEPIWLGLTAGYDSRLMLALSQMAKIKIRPFTRMTARMSVADRLLPSKLTPMCGYLHTALHRGQRFPERHALVEAHSGGQISAGDAEPFVRGDRDGLEGISFGGHGFAIANGFYKLRELPATLNSAAEGAQHIANLFQEPLTSTATAGLQDWLTWVLDHPEPHLDWRDRFFLEQRQAGWLSSKEQVYDLCNLERVPVLNCARLYALLLSIPVEQRQGSDIQLALLRRVAPELMTYPFNPDDFYFGLPQILTAKANDLPKYVLGKMVRKFHYLCRAVPL